MASSRERERRLPAAQNAVTCAQRNVDALRARVKRAEEMIASADRDRDQAECRLAGALAHLAWVESMPVDGETTLTNITVTASATGIFEPAP